MKHWNQRLGSGETLGRPKVLTLSSDRMFLLFCLFHAHLDRVLHQSRLVLEPSVVTFGLFLFPEPEPGPALRRLQLQLVKRSKLQRLQAGAAVSAPRWRSATV